MQLQKCVVVKNRAFKHNTKKAQHNASWNECELILIISIYYLRTTLKFSYEAELNNDFNHVKGQFLQKEFIDKTNPPHLIPLI